MNRNLLRDQVLALRVFGIAWTMLHVFYGLITAIVIAYPKHFPSGERVFECSTVFARRRT